LFGGKEKIAGNGHVFFLLIVLLGEWVFEESILFLLSLKKPFGFLAKQTWSIFLSS
jgi:hypothetical protein